MIIGYMKGFLYQIINIVYTVFCVAVAWFASPVLAELFPLISIDKIDSQYSLLNSFFNLDKLLNTAAYFVIVFLVLKVIYIFIALLTKSLNKIPVLGKLNKILGMIVGILNATIIVFALSMLLSLPLFKNGKEVKENTVFKYIEKYTNQAVSVIAEKIVAKSGELKDIDVESYRRQFYDWLSSLGNNE
ncbi:MAG: CvpA family protein [Erysipelotrichaceae bacterium]|nr:CvpA family protein [Erysipelotrichaceae bacterium]